MIYGKLSADGRLSDVRRGEPIAWPDGSQDVELVSMPKGFGPWTYDAEQKTAVSATLTEPEKLDSLSLPPRVQAAIVLRLSASWADLSAARKARVQAVLDQAGAKVLALLT